jgi:hypothetical protein
MLPLSEKEVQLGNPSKSCFQSLPDALQKQYKGGKSQVHDPVPKYIPEI